MIAKASQAIFLNNYLQIIGNIFKQAISISNNKNKYKRRALA